MTIHMIWAVSQDGYIGKNGRIPWNVPEDLALFKQMTEGKTIVMGRKTWESLGKMLPNRKHVILSKQYGYSFKFPHLETYIYEDIYTLMRNCDKSFWVIGGQEIYKAFLPYADHLVKTQIDVIVNGDVKFPGMFPPDWREISDTGWKNSMMGPRYRTMEYIRND